MNPKWPIHPWFLIPQILLVVIISVLLFHLSFLNKTYLGLKVAGIDVGGAKKEVIIQKLSQVKLPEFITLEHEGKTFNLYPEDFHLAYDINASAENALIYGRNKRLIPSLKHKLEAARGKVDLPLTYTTEEDKLDELISLLSGQVSVPPVEPKVSLETGVVLVDPGKKGFVVDEEKLKSGILQTLSTASANPITIPITELNPELSEDEVQVLKTKAERILGRSLQITFEYQTFTYRDFELVTLLTPAGINEEKLNIVVEELAAGVERPAQNARFVFENGKVKEFTPALKGIKINKETVKTNLTKNLESLMTSDKKSSSFKLSVSSSEPEIANSEVNNLGIKELIGRGTSNFKGSIPGRIHNLSLAASKINGVLIKPGETFSFNNTLGEVSNNTGYQQAYIISGGRTILGDGGGVCQTSTTFFRAALNTGLPIVERHDHAYRVSYYEQDSKPGLDATIFIPNIDLKVQNNTPAHILIQTKVDKVNMAMVIELYGTSDGRVTETSNFRLWDVRPAPAPLYQDDPTLPVGKTKQVDFASPSGKAAFDYKVTRSGETLENKTFYSNYKAWQAVYLRGTAPTQ